MLLIFGIILSLFVGYALGGLVIFLIPIIASGYLLYVFSKPAIARYIERKRERTKLKRLLKERLKYIP